MTDIHNIQNMLVRRRELRKRSTKQEQALWQKLKNKKLGYKFRRQHSIGGYVTDFYCAECRLVIEIDGSSHNKEVQKEYDIIRDTFLRDLNHTVLRFKNENIDSSLDKVIKKITLFFKDLSQPSPKLGKGKSGVYL